MSDIAIRVDGIGKKYKLGKKKSGDFRESFAHFWDTIRLRQNGNGHREKSEFWALKDISFEVKKGEAVGIIGRNGAGKSTLLKVLSRITKPTTGRFEINGRVSSLLEVGTGFHPELTGRENIYLNGTILGMRRAEIKAKFDEIIDFSGVEDFIDTPVKHYSSGMKVRLAFSVAAYLEPEILIIDEVLAVGDAEFQKKCLGKMEDVAGEGRTVLFVSHNMGAVELLCKKVLVFDSGTKVNEGYQVSDIIGTYLTKFQEVGMVEGYCKWLDFENRLFNNQYHSFSKIELMDNDGNTLSSVITDSTPINILIQGSLHKVDPSLNFGYAIYSGSTVLFWSWLKDHTLSQYQLNQLGSFTLQTQIPIGYLGNGNYTIEFFSVLHGIKYLIKKGEGVQIPFVIEGGHKGVKLHPKFKWEEKTERLV